ncbi:hypothetical protein F4801DRAFT_554148 [Xylaria longipes]|nr:hypothetical protein F4801DRAFT_554148 [Xylaria longipes]
MSSNRFPSFLSFTYFSHLARTYPHSHNPTYAHIFSQPASLLSHPTLYNTLFIPFPHHAIFLSPAHPHNLSQHSTPRIRVFKTCPSDMYPPPPAQAPLFLLLPSSRARHKTAPDTPSARLRPPYQPTRYYAKAASRPAPSEVIVAHHHLFPAR